MFDEVKSDVVSTDGIRRYAERFRTLETTTLAKLTSGIDRFTTVVAFNEYFYHRRYSNAQHPLADVAYVARIGVGGDLRQTDQLARLVIAYLTESRWSEIYGLSYIQTMQLSYAEWIYMQHQLNKQTAQQIPSEP